MITLFVILSLLDARVTDNSNRFNNTYSYIFIFSKINSIILVRLIGKVRKQSASLIVQLSINYFIMTGVTIKIRKY